MQRGDRGCTVWPDVVVVSWLCISMLGVLASCVWWLPSLTSLVRLYVLLLLKLFANMADVATEAEVDVDVDAEAVAACELEFVPSMEPAAVWAVASVDAATEVDTETDAYRSDLVAFVNAADDRVMADTVHVCGLLRLLVR